MIDYKLKPPRLRRERENPLSFPELPLMPKALFLLSIPKYNRSLIFIYSSSVSSTMNLLFLVPLEPSSIFYLIPSHSSSWNCLIPTVHLPIVICLTPMTNIHPVGVV